MRWLRTAMAVVALLTLAACTGQTNIGRAAYSYCGISFGYERPTVINAAAGDQAPVTLPPGSNVLVKVSENCSSGAVDIQAEEFQSVHEYRKDHNVILLAVTVGTRPAKLSFTTAGRHRSVEFSPVTVTPSSGT